MRSWCILVMMLGGCRVNGEFFVAASDRPVLEPYEMGPRVSRDACQRFVFGIQLDDAYSVADELAALGADGPIAQVVVEETVFVVPIGSLYSRRCLTVSGTRILPATVSTSVSVGPEAPLVGLSPVSPQELTATGLVLMVRSQMGEAGSEGAQALRLLLDAAKTDLESCFAQPGRVSVEVAIRPNGTVWGTDPVRGDAATSQCVRKRIQAMTTTELPVLTKLEVEAEVR